MNAVGKALEGIRSLKVRLQAVEVSGEALALEFGVARLSIRRLDAAAAEIGPRVIRPLQVDVTRREEREGKSSG